MIDWTGAATPDELGLVTHSNGYHTRLHEFTAASASSNPATARYAQGQLARLQANRASLAR
jgi:hypothetical protein